MPLIKKDSETYRIVGLIGSFGFTTAGAVAGGYFLGSYLDKKFNSSPWFMLSLIILGITASFIEFFKLIKKLNNESKK
ncbi:MAG TPA: AtpZ/AtpI family protein [Candidatus Wujingus californicus]|uniref:AtpZ/AtpI family protein n=1 Tax=Candidatus Wujingus californicus TaxID=3367618 RepID=UPI001DBE3EA7|nr:AtpZ/AtpI family protein [Planctomycetota bacterium]MDO8132091.1 AtpZ/AtpI family protein [Candidatus Brocadiales bacterium]